MKSVESKIEKMCELQKNVIILETFVEGTQRLCPHREAIETDTIFCNVCGKEIDSSDKFLYYGTWPNLKKPIKKMLIKATNLIKKYQDKVDTIDKDISEIRNKCEHNWSSWNDPTLNGGSRSRICTICNDQEIEWVGNFSNSFTSSENKTALQE